MTGTRKCKICGKEYPYCQTPNPTGAFIWKDVGCCVEHAEEYLAQVMAARSGQSAEVKAVKAESKPALIETETKSEEIIKDAGEADNSQLYKPKKRHE